MTTLASLYVPARARAELTWFYKQAAAELGDSSNFRLIDSAPRLQAHLDPGDAEETGHDLDRLAARRASTESDHLLDLRQEARVKLRAIWGALEAIDAAHRKAIESLYVERQWPNALADRFGEVNEAARATPANKKSRSTGDQRESVLGLLAISSVAREAFTAEVVVKRAPDGLGPVVEGSKTVDGFTVHPNGRRIAVRQVAILDWLDNICRHNAKDRHGLLIAIDSECKAMSLSAHRAYAVARGMFLRRCGSEAA